MSPRASPHPHPYSCGVGPRGRGLFSKVPVPQSFSEGLHFDRALRDWESGPAPSPQTPLGSIRLQPFLWASLGQLSGCVWPEGEDLSLGLKGPDHQDWVLPALPCCSRRSRCTAGCEWRRPRGGGWREGHNGSGQTLQLAEASAKTFPRPAPLPSTHYQLGVCVQTAAGLFCRPPLPPAPSLLPNASQMAFPSQALPFLPGDLDAEALGST